MRFYLCIARDGWAKADEFCYPRWAICLSRDEKVPAFRWRNGGPQALTKPSAMKEAPLWQRRAVAYVHTLGGLTVEECDRAVQWFRAHRTGFPTEADVCPLAAK